MKLKFFAVYHLVTLVALFRFANDAVDYMAIHDDGNYHIKVDFEVSE